MKFIAEETVAGGYEMRIVQEGLPDMMGYGNDAVEAAQHLLFLF